jgi:hypothetical protein
MSDINESVRVTMIFIFFGAPFALCLASFVGLGVTLFRRRSGRTAR